MYGLCTFCDDDGRHLVEVLEDDELEMSKVYVMCNVHKEMYDGS